MPNYTYECLECSSVFDIRVSIEEMEKGNFFCQKCGSTNTRRIFDGFSYCKGNGSSGCASCKGGNCSTCNH